MIRKILPGLLIVGFLVGFGCSGPSGSDEDDEGGEGSGEETTTYELTADANPSDGGRVDPESGEYEEGEEVEVTATAADGWEFDQWSGDANSSDNSLTVTITENTSLTAEFSEEPPPTYDLSVSTDPSDVGSVDPESGTYEEGEEVTVEATAEDGWSFSGWSGDISSDENPLTFEIDSDTEILANFEEQPREYSNEVEVTDGIYTEDLTFGMDDNGTADYDEGLDEEAPPEPPEGSFYANFVIDNYNLYADNRAVTDDRVEWELHFGTDSDNNITLNWDFNPADYHGSLMLVDDLDDASIEVDMDSDSSFEVTDKSINMLYIIQE